MQKEIDNIRKIAFMSVIRCRSCLFILADLYTIYPFFQYLWGTERFLDIKKVAREGFEPTTPRV